MPHKTTVKTNGQTLKVNASVSHWTTEALARTASGTNDVESTTTTTITADYDLWFPDTATTATITVSQFDGTTLATYTGLQVNPGVGTRVLSPIPDAYQIATDVGINRSPVAAAALYESVPRNSYSANLTAASSGQMLLVGIKIPAGTVVSSISFLSGTTAGSAMTAQWFALYDPDLVLLGQTTDDTSTAWAANAIKTLSFATAKTTTKTGLHYAGICVVGSTVPSYQGPTGNQYITGLTPKLAGTSTTGLTTTAPDPAGAMTAVGSIPYCYVS